MRLKRDTGELYELRFDIDDTTGIFETNVAASAMGLSPHNREVLGIDMLEQVHWDELEARIMQTYMQYPPNVASQPIEPGEIARPLNLKKPDPQRLGQGLLYYYDTTPDAEHLMAQQGKTGANISNRRSMAFVALEMCEVLRTHVEMIEPPQPRTHDLPVGFQVPR